MGSVRHGKSLGVRSQLIGTSILYVSRKAPFAAIDATVGDVTLGSAASGAGGSLVQATRNNGTRVMASFRITASNENVRLRWLRGPRRRVAVALLGAHSAGGARRPGIESERS